MENFGATVTLNVPQGLGRPRHPSQVPGWAGAGRGLQPHAAGAGPLCVLGRNAVNLLGQGSISGSLVHSLKLTYRGQCHWGEGAAGSQRGQGAGMESSN